MTRITNDLRSSIVTDSINQTFEKEQNAITKKENSLAMQCYYMIFDAATIAAVANVPKGWIRENDDCLRFNCNGYDVRLKVKEVTKVPFGDGYNCKSLGSISDALAEKVIEFLGERDELKDRASKAHRALSAMLGQINTFKQLEAAWPEGKKFYAKYIEVRGESALPVIQVSEVNSMLGLKQLNK